MAVKNAGRTLTDQDGKFMLYFRTLKPGDKVEVRDIGKMGYEVFNKDAVEAWRVGNDDAPFTIVLCKSETFKALKDKYNAIASMSYAQQEAKEVAKLNELLKKGKMQQADYERQVQELKNQYEEQLENLDSYIDRFARIDLSELSAEEQEIVQLVQDGQIDPAIERYDKMNLLAKMEELSKQQAEVQSAQAALAQKQQEIAAQEMKVYEMISNQISLLGLAGGKENFARIATLHETAAKQLANNPIVVKNCAVFFLKQHSKKAVDWFSAYLAIPTLSNSQRSLGEKHLADAYLQMGMVDQSLEHNQKALNILGNIQDEHSVDDLITYATIYCNRSTILQSVGRLEEAKAVAKRSIVVSDSITATGIENQEITRNRFICQYNLCYILLNLGQAEEALAESKKLVEYAHNHMVESDPQSVECYAGATNQLGFIYMQMRRLVEAEQSLMLSLKTWQKLYDNNPQAYTYHLYHIVNNLATTFVYAEDYNRARTFLERSIALAEDLRQEQGGNDADNLYASEMNNMGYVEFLEKNYEEALFWYNKALPILETLSNKHQDSYALNLLRTRVNIFQTYLQLQRFKDCQDLDAVCMKEANALHNSQKELSMHVYLSAYCMHGELLYHKNKKKEARAVWKMIQETDPNFVKLNPSVAFIQIMEKDGE